MASETAKKARAVAHAARGNYSPLIRLIRPAIAPVLAGLMIIGLSFGGSFLAGVLSFNAAQSQNSTLNQNCVLQNVTTGSLPVSTPDVYRGILTKAAAKYGTDVSLLDTILFVENGQRYPEPPPPYGAGKPFPVSRPGAQGLMQFMPGTWAMYAEDGNGDGKIDVNDVSDSIFAASHLLSKLGGLTGTPLGSVDTPYVTPTLINAMGKYNGGLLVNFANSETFKYIRIGAEHYTKLTTNATTNPYAVTQIQVCSATAVSVVNHTCPDGTAPKSVYVLGDTMGLAANAGGLGQTLKDRGYSVSLYATPNFTLAGAIKQVPSLQELKTVSMMVIAFDGSVGDPTGTAYQAAVLAFTKAVKLVNPTISMWWVNSANTKAQSNNGILSKQATSSGFTLEDWHGAVYPSARSNVPDPALVASTVPGPEGQTVLTPEGSKRLSELVTRTFVNALPGNQFSGCNPEVIQNGPVDASGWVWPITLADYTLITQCWNNPRNGGHHTGIDIGVSSKPAIAAHTGAVVQTGFDSAAGNYVIVKVSDSLFYSYEHLSVISIAKGQPVTAGQRIGTTGNTGNSTGAHLHFGVAVAQTLGSYGDNSQTRDALDYLPKDRSEAPCR